MSLRRRLCARFSPKCAFTAVLVCVAGSILLAVLSSHARGPKKIPLHQLLEETSSGKTAGQRDLIYRGFSGKRGDILSIAVGEETTYYHRRNASNADGQLQAQQVVSILNMVKPAPTGRPIGKKLLNAQVELLRQTILAEEEKVGRWRGLEPKARCMGGTVAGEVEDLLCIPKPKYLEEVKNPCWYDEREALSDQSSQLRCLPYFHILGCAKAGTTDLWNRLMEHPHIISNDGLLHKEALWWSWRRFGFYGYKKGLPQTFRDYVDLYQDTAKLIQSSLNSGNHYRKVLITGDASPPDFWDFRGWRNISQNRGLDVPHVITPHMMKHFYREPRFILMFKDPIDRLYSDYFFVGSGLTSEDFHRDIVQSISMLADCVRKSTIQTCFYDNALYKQMKVRLPFACYSVFMREWLRVFSLDRFLFIKTEEYEKDPADTLKEVMAFLGLQKLKERKMHEIVEEERSRITLQKQVAGPMKASTKRILNQLLQPCNRQLAQMIQQPRFVWDS